MTAAPTVAIVGLTGFLAKHVINALISEPYKSQISTPIRLVTRDETKAKAAIPAIEASPDLFKFYKADAATGEGLAEAFEGATAIVNLAGTGFSHDKISDAAAKAKTNLYVASEFGVPTTEKALGKYAPVFDFKIKATQQARDKGLKTVAVYNGLFTEFAFRVPGAGGLQSTTEAQTYVPDKEYATTSLVDIGRSVAALVTKSATPEEAGKLPDELFIKGGSLSGKTVADIISKLTGKEVALTEKPQNEIVDRATQVVENGVKGRDDFFAVLQALFTQGLADYEANAEAVIADAFETPEEVAKRVFK
ncbi:uncharacterized protein SAPINGB_P003802 [Magnusiomyces paraingens]|uniref:NmrA-like domain-containing protein n=1 Tax=Magnusiomyces paraingens TaxID=2606893 RepID=A0A5E8BS85_9ASCO|nr:uncharacterized protein SAPINGB_P003802 [Saprochaete ingens]VVT53891.1 unnamed protein product [Saprochaete ingens]